MVGIYARTFHLKVLALADAPPARTMCKVPQSAAKCRKVPQSAATCRMAKLAVLAHAATQHVGLPTQLEGTLKKKPPLPLPLPCSRGMPLYGTGGSAYLGRPRVSNFEEAIPSSD
jgi:hypothetical protein